MTERRARPETARSHANTGGAGVAPVPGLVSVVVPACNAERWVAETVQSVLSQDYEAIEAIVVDDGSTDATARVVERLAGSDPRIRLLSFPNGGLACARNRGLAAARGEWVSFVDADDLWAPQKVREQLAALAGRTHAVALCGVRRFHDDSKGREWLHETPVPKVTPGRSAVRDVLLLRNDQMVVFNTALLRADGLRAIGGFCEGLVSSEDWELWLRAAREFTMVSVPRALHLYRKHPGSLTVRTPLEAVLSLQLSLIERERSQGNVGAGDASRAVREKLLEFACAAEWRNQRALAASLLARGLLRHGGVRTPDYYRTIYRMTARALTTTATPRPGSNPP